MSKKLYLVNASEPYVRGKFATAAHKLDVDYEYVDLKECVFYADGKHTHFYNNNTKIDPKKGYFFIRRKDTDNFYAYLLTEFLHQHQADFNDACNRSHTRSDGKIAQLIRLTEQGVPFPESFVCRPYSFTLHRDLIVEKIGFPCVVKRTGARGEAVWFIDSEEKLMTKMEEAPFEVHLVQKYMPNDYDVRVIVFEDQVIGAMTRSSDDGFANTSYNAVLELTQISDEEQQLALDVAKKSGVDFAGVDVVRTSEGLKVWEVNKTPQLDRFIPATGIEAIECVLNHIQQKYTSC